MSGENYRSFTKSHEPGWNDPPKVAFVEQPRITSSSPGSHAKTPLNKRVAFPLQNQTPGRATQIGAIGHGQPMPPVLPNVQPMFSPPIADMAVSQSGGRMEQKQDDCKGWSGDRDEIFGQVKSSFDDAIRRMEVSRREEIQKRINLIYESWTTGKLPEGLERTISDLANALLEKDAARSSAVHRSIICDYGSKCALWAPALRQLIFALPSQDDEENVANVITKPI